MRSLIQILCIALLVALGVPVFAQSASKYTCVMHPEVMQDNPGNCPKCGMTLVLKQVGTPLRGVHENNHPPSHGSGVAGEHEMTMHSSIDIADPMSRESSGTAWVPDSTPMYGKMFMFGDDMLMLHGGAFPRYTNVSTAAGRRSHRHAELVHGDVFPFVRRKFAARFSRHDESRSADGRWPRLSAYCFKAAKRGTINRCTIVSIRTICSMSSP